MIEEATYVVRMELATTIDFSPIERERAIDEADAIANAEGTFPDKLFRDFMRAAEAEGWDFSVRAERIR
jgi:hypothetical protein